MRFLDSKEKKIGFYSTIIIHLVVLIIFLITAIHRVVATDASFVLDFTKQEELEMIEKLEQLKSKAQQEVEELLRSNNSSSSIRNVAVDRGERLKDDRFKNPNTVYDEARELQEKLDKSRADALKEQGSDDNVAIENKKREQEKSDYKGPSVISYTLDKRKAISLPVPVYKCKGGGDVSVRIVVNRKGYVTAAQVIDSASSADDCIRECAVAAAKRSRFTSSATADEKQIGEIVYRFIAQ